MTHTETHYDVINTGQGLVKAWIRGVPLEDAAREQLENVARLPFVHKWVAAMPDVHWGYGATVGSVIPTHRAIVPAAVGVDIGCGMIASRTTLTASDLPDSLREVRERIERAVPHGFTDKGGKNDRGSWHSLPARVAGGWAQLADGYEAICEREPKVAKGKDPARHLGTLGSGNHFIEVCLDEADRVWFMLHSGSRGVGNRIGRRYIELAREDMRTWFVNLPDENLAYFPEGTEHFASYVGAVEWAQRFAALNRELMLEAVIEAVRGAAGIPEFQAAVEAVNCHHNYVAKEHHFGADVWVTRKGAVRAREGDLGIIPGSMGAKSYIVRGKGNDDAFHSCSHGAGRAMSRSAARQRFSVEEHVAATQGIECRKDEGVIDETPAAYKSIDAVMDAQRDLVDVVHTLRQVVCVKG